jgi:hypothetical protein
MESMQIDRQGDKERRKHTEKKNKKKGDKT